MTQQQKASVRDSDLDGEKRGQVEARPGDAIFAGLSPVLLFFSSSFLHTVIHHKSAKMLNLRFYAFHIYLWKVISSIMQTLRQFTSSTIVQNWWLPLNLLKSPFKPFFWSGEGSLWGLGGFFLVVFGTLLLHRESKRCICHHQVLLHHIKAFRYFTVNYQANQ